MPYTVTLELPDSFGLSIGGQDVTFNAADLPAASYQHALEKGLERLASYSFTSPAGNIKKAWVEDKPGRKAEDFVLSSADETKLRDAVVNRFKSGDWGRTGQTITDPIGTLAKRLAEQLIRQSAKDRAIACGFDRIAAQSARDATLRDSHKKVAAFYAVYGSWSGKNGNSFVFDADKVADLIERKDLRAEAEAELARTAENAQDVDLDDFAI